MRSIQFNTVIGSDLIIRIPEGTELAPGEVEVVVRQATASTKPVVSMAEYIQRLSQVAEELGIDDLPTDLAENHDHYVHGLPKGIDRP